MPTTISSAARYNLDRRTEAAKARVHQLLLYWFGRAIPDLNLDGEAEHNMQELADAIFEAAELSALQRLHNRSGVSME